MISHPSLSDFGTHDESRFSELWAGCIGAWAPCLGPTGFRLHDFSRRNNWASFNNMLADSDWVVSDGLYSLDFDGSNDFLDVTINQPSPFFSVSLWANVRSFANQPLLYTFVNSLNDGGFLETNSNGQQLFWGVRTTPSQVNFRTYTLSSPLVANRWYHFCVTKGAAGDSGELYVNGRLEQNFTGTLNSTPTTATKIHFASYMNSLFLNGQLDDMRLYGRSLSQGEVSLLSTHRGVSYQCRRRRSYFSKQVGFNPAWARNSNYIISPVGAA